MLAKKHFSKIQMVSVAVSALVLASLPFCVQAETVKIGALVSGQVSKVWVKEGDDVKTGQKLINLDASRYQAKLSYLKAQQALQEAKLKDAQIELDTALDLYDRTVTSKRTLDAAKLAYSVVEAEAQKARAAVKQHQSWEKYVYIKSPVSAKVTKIHAPVGTTVYKENNPLIELQTQE